jgi:unsaturated rhamnogalacturonyl hydrolase
VLQRVANRFHSLFAINIVFLLLFIMAAPAAAQVDWGARIAEAALTDAQGRSKSGAARPWQYQQALYLLGMMRVYERTGDGRLLEHVRQWGYRHVEPDGTIVAEPGVPVELATLDSLMPGQLVLKLWQVTGDSRFQRAAETIRQRLKDWPRTQNGAFWHRDAPDNRFASNVVWADGSFMFAPFLAQYSRLFPADANTGRDEAARQLEAYGELLDDPDTSLIRHAFDQDRDFAWARLPRSQQAPVVWCRAVGWYGMSLVAVLDALPEGHPRRAGLLERLARLMEGYRRYLWPQAGGWRQVMDQPATVTTEGAPLDNFVETSCTAMHAFVVGRAVEEGWAGLAQHRAAAIAVQGVVDRLTMHDGRASLTGGVRGTGIGASAAAYLDTSRIATDDPHALGAFLFMYESALRQSAEGSVLLSRPVARAQAAAAPRRAAAPAPTSGPKLIPFPTDRLNPVTLIPIDRGQGSLAFDLPKAGTYRLWGRFRTPAAIQGTLSVRIDGGPWRAWEVLPHPDEPRWDPLLAGSGYATPVLLTLAAGAHTIELDPGKTGIVADSFLLTTARLYVPIGDDR